MKGFLIAAAASVMIVGALPARAELRTEEDYFHCGRNGSTPVISAPRLTLLPLPSWSVVAPPGAITAGNGCVGATNYAGSSGYNSPYDNSFEGSFEGEIDSLTVRAYFAFATIRPSSVRISLHLGVDGKSLFGTVDTASLGKQPTPVNVVVAPTYQSNGLALCRFTISDIGFTGDAQVGSHVVNLTLNPRWEQVSMMFLDSTDAPSGLAFNPATAEKAVLKATTPGPL